MSNIYKEQTGVYELAFPTRETASTFIKALQPNPGPLWFSAGKTSAFTITFLSASTYPGRSTVRTP